MEFLGYIEPERFLTLREVSKRTGRGKTRIYADMRRDPPAFPRPVKDGSSSRWVESEIAAWIRDKVTVRDGQVAA
jgi:prophage regulatory protein